jgi:hypothetical protein
MTYTSPYARNLNKMTNKEQVSLAQNRFTDEETQVAIAKNYYRLAREYLANNPSVTPEAANELWKHKGYVLKCALLSNGKKTLSDEEALAFYRKNFKGRKNRSWRMYTAFLGTYNRYGRDRAESNNTPGVLLEEMYEDEKTPTYYTIRRFVEHPNCTLNLALKISTMKLNDRERQYYTNQWEDVKRQALMRVAEITKRESAIPR